MSELSFRGVLCSLQIAQIEGYLTDSGWSPTRPLGSSVQQYVLAIEGTDRQYQLTLPTNRTHAGFTDQLYRLVFNVSCIEDREPMEVARDMRLQSPAELGDPVMAAFEHAFEREEFQGIRSDCEQVITDLKATFARAEFVAAALGEGTPEALQMKTAIVLVPVSKRLSRLDEGQASQLVAHLVSRIFRVDVSDPPSLLLTLKNDDEDAPTASLAALKALR